MDNLQRRTDVVIAGYLLTTAALVAAFHEQFALWKALVAAHLLASAFIYCLRFLPPKLPGVVQFFRDWYPVMVLPPALRGDRLRSFPLRSRRDRRPRPRGCACRQLSRGYGPGGGSSRHDSRGHAHGQPSRLRSGRPIPSGVPHQEYARTMSSAVGGVTTRAFSLVLRTS